MSDFGPLHHCSATTYCQGGRNDTGDWSRVDCPDCLRSKPQAVKGRVPELLVTMCPSMPHFDRFATDPRISGMRLNLPMLSPDEVQHELDLATADGAVRGDIKGDLCFDVKSRQLRVQENLENPDYCDVRLNHAIDVETPFTVLLKGGNEAGEVGKLLENGRRLQFSANPTHQVHKGESLHIRTPFEVISADLITQEERNKIDRVIQSGVVNRWFLSYVEEQRDVDRLRELVGPDAEILLKIESMRGIEYVANTWSRDTAPNTRLVAACGDLYVEVGQPHHILTALRMIADRDPRAVAGSRMLLSLVWEPVPSLADLAQLSWLYDIGFKSFLLCDELCLKESMLGTAINVFEAWASTVRHRNV